jgi:hypothetical protein
LIEGKRRRTPLYPENQPTRWSFRYRPWQTKKYTSKSCRTRERESALEDLIRLVWQPAIVRGGKSDKPQPPAREYEVKL